MRFPFYKPHPVQAYDKFGFGASTYFPLGVLLVSLFGFILANFVLARARGADKLASL